MKIRKGFVSNSSSSSFLVTLPKAIENYSLEEFRELITYNKFDPVEKLYNDLINKEKSQPLLDKWEQKRYGIKQLDYNQYIVEYGNECVNSASNVEYEEQVYMEDTFMGDIEQDSDFEISVNVYSNH